MTNYMIIKTQDGKVYIKERKEKNTKPFITTEDNCFTNILDSKKIEENYKKSPKLTKGLIKRINKLLSSKTIQNEIRKFLKTIDDNDINNTLLLIDYLEEKYENLERIIDEIDLKRSSKQVDIEIRSACIERKNNIEILEGMIYSSNNENGKITEEIINTLKERLETIDINNIKESLKRLSNNPDIENQINEVNKLILNAHNKEEIKHAYYLIMNLIKTSEEKKSFERLYNDNEELALSVISKQILINYVQSILKRCKLKDMYELEIYLSRGIQGIDILVQQNPELIDRINPEVTEYLNLLFEQELDNMIDNQSSVICFNCTNGYTSRCQKIADIEKEEIQNYPFIIRGYQVYKNDRLDKFIVGKCADYSTVPHYSKRKLTAPEFKKAKKELARLYNEREGKTDGYSKAIKKIPKSKRIQ